ncbi:hypothetical protein M2447_002340 [Ereboglobus sp. PH5-10]|uniref:MvaI/BcnI family restriction endonuclease n=1 Tax=Ereboglobus sp. PH5-10 TaxID=2940629 RepID=UPI002406E7EA|nr:MvaI/BcnI family restriction endonuclease [Ereboglobus sp. PH5-10]MDF9828222.1 hypothetical protein [Ereboglobus sp. PH5-10]
MKLPSAMHVRPLDRAESKNLQLLNAAGIESVPLFLTPTGFKKSICDATSAMRELFKKHDIHDYERQAQGQHNKVSQNIMFLSENGTRFFKMSLYRPNTKKGDPRFWVNGWKQEVAGDHVLAFFHDADCLCVVNLSTTDLSAPFLRDYLNRHAAKARRISEELLEKLRVLAKSPIPASGIGDTFIGRDVETALGIPINSSRNPDYKGIELKSKRLASKTRMGLFAQIPDWNLSAVKSTSEFLDKFGYMKGPDFRLYCTVSSKSPNSQGLFLSVNDLDRMLWEKHRGALRDESVVAWKLSTLESRLEEKHSETFWIKADSIRKNGREFFLLKSVTHTSSPNLPQFSRLLATGDITVDHMIKRIPSGRLTEKGPQFKVRPEKRNELFLGKPMEYDLLA